MVKFVYAAQSYNPSHDRTKSPLVTKRQTIPLVNQLITVLFYQRFSLAHCWFTICIRASASVAVVNE